MTLRYSTRLFLAGIGLGLLPGCSQGLEPRETQRTYSLAEVSTELNFERYLSVVPAGKTTDGDIDTYEFDPAGPARCFTGSPYRVSVRKGASPNVMLYLQGGGACYSEETCFTKPISRDQSEPLSAAAGAKGVFSAAEANPFREWNIVYAAYCDGSLWMGDADAIYGARVAYHHGMANAAATVALMKQVFPAPEKLVVAGSSAGGYGTLMGYMIGRTVFPQTKMAVLNDSGPWLLNPANGDMTKDIHANWNSWNAAAFRAPACPLCGVDLYRIADWAMQQDGATRWGLFSFDRDLVIAELYMRYGARYPEILGEMAAYLEGRHPGQFHAFMAEGADHTRLATDAFYDVSRDGQQLSAWIASLVNDREDWKSIPEMESP